MLVSVSAPASANGANDYYVKGSSKNPVDGKYYLDQAGKSVWGGGAKHALGLPDGPVQSEDFINMLTGKLPNGQQLGRMVDNKLKRDIGRDMTVSMSKLSSIFASGSSRDAILAAFDRSIAKGMKFFENEIATTRIYNKESSKQVLVGNQKIVYAAFREHLNRANEPHIHAHIVWPNITLGQDGKFRSTNMGAAYTNKILMGAVMRSYFGDEMKKMGLTLVPAGKHGLWEIGGISRKTIDAFSTRRADILKAAKRGPKDAITLSRLVLKTRPAKTRISGSEIEKRTNATFERLGQTIKNLWDKALGMPAPEKVGPADALRNAISDLSETQRDFARLDLLKAGLISVYGNVTVDALQTEIDKQVESGKLLCSKDGKFYTTPLTLRLEESVISEWKKGHLKGGIISAAQFNAAVKEFQHFTKGQMNAAKLILTSKDRVNGVQGTAGTGKTTLLKASLPFAKAAGLRLVGIAPSGAAVTELKETGIFDKVMTSQKYVQTPIGDAKSMLVVDESSMLGTDDMLSILKFANSKNIKGVVLMGDVDQLSAVNAGIPFKDLQKAGLRTAHMIEIVRQKDVRHRQGVTEFAKGHVAKALSETLSKEVHEVTRQDIPKYAARIWHRLDDSKAPVVVQTNHQKQQVNDAIKAIIRLNQYAPPPGTDHKVWRPVILTERERSLYRSYEDVSHIRFNRSRADLNVRANDVFKIVDRNERRSTLILSNGERRINFIPAKHGNGQSMIETYRQDTIGLNTGDRIRFTRGQRGPIDNNDMGNILTISAERISFEMDGGKTIELSMKDKTIRHLDHSWAATAHAVQGKTVNNAIAIMPSNEGPLTTLNGLYTGASRHRDTLAIITDDSNRLVKTLEADIETKLNKVRYVTDKLPEKQTEKARAHPMVSVDAKTKLNRDGRSESQDQLDKYMKEHHDKLPESELPQPERQRQSQRQLEQERQRQPKRQDRSR